MALHGVFYDCRPLEGGKWGIVVKVFIRGEWIETDLNTMPWPTAEIAVDRAYRAACCRADNEPDNLPVIRAYATRPRHLLGHKSR